jgi:D-aspartate ligase
MQNNSVKDRKCIIFGRNTGNVLGQIRSFGEEGIKSIVVWYGFDGHNPRDSKYVEEFIEVMNENDGLKYIIDRFGNQGIKHFLSTDNDGLVGLMDQNYDKLKDSFIFFNAGEQGRLSVMMEKQKLCELAEKNGLRTPKSQIVKNGELNHGIAYPVFIKATDSFDVHWKNTVSICRNEEELKQYYTKRPSINKVLIQEYIKKKNEYILQGLSVNGGKELYLPIEGYYYRFPEDAYGSYLYFEEYKGGVDLYNQLKQMFIDINYSGVFEIEFLVGPDDCLYFLEINFRHTLWNHTFTDMGINLCTIWANSEIEGHLVTNGAKIKCKRQNLMREFEDFKRCMKNKNLSLLQWLKDLYHSDSFVVYDKKDQRPFYKYISTIIKRLF